ncbi:MAG TPA: hypothetical protein VGJ30_17175, partial [Candidatus Angelobacter sp.]
MVSREYSTPTSGKTLPRIHADERGSENGAGDCKKYGFRLELNRPNLLERASSDRQRNENTWNMAG